jgi:UDP-GlcNAc:undecaprenyl-phosphate GlcNAc-1-phosphate transferase
MLIYTMILATSVFVTWLLIKYSDKIGILDIPNERSQHKTPIPRTGGWAILIATVVGIFIYDIKSISHNYGLSISILLIVVLGFVDDKYGVTYRTKFIFISIATIFAFYNGYQIKSLGIFYEYEISLGYLALPFTVFAVVGFTNASNLMDGLDGLAAQINIIILASFAYLGYLIGDSIILNLSGFLITALIGFWFFNRYPAKIFQGDLGALTIGFIISLLAIRLIGFVNPTSILLLTFVPLSDTIIVMFRRFRVGKSPFTPDKTHLHHIVLKIKYKNVSRSVNLLSIIQIVFTLVGIKRINDDQLITLLIFILSIYIFYQLFTATLIFRREKISTQRKKLFFEEKDDEN